MAERQFKRYTLNEFAAYLRTFPDKVRFSEVHVHHTYEPTIADYRRQANKENLIRAMWRYHTKTRGWQDIAQHATVDPDGYIWGGRSLSDPPASATGYNDSDADRVHPFMFEMIGNFDNGQEKLEGAQLQTVLGLVAAVIDIWGLALKHIRFHREMTPSKSCPGTSLVKEDFIAQVNQAIKARRGGTVMPAAASKPTLPEIEERIRVILNENKNMTGYLIEGTTYVPLRQLAEALGAQIGWSPESRTATVTTEGD